MNLGLEKYSFKKIIFILNFISYVRLLRIEWSKNKLRVNVYKINDLTRFFSDFSCLFFLI